MFVVGSTIQSGRDEGRDRILGLRLAIDEARDDLGKNNSTVRKGNGCAWRNSPLAAVAHKQTVEVGNRYDAGKRAKDVAPRLRAPQLLGRDDSGCAAAPI